MVQLHCCCFSCVYFGVISTEAQVLPVIYLKLYPDWISQEVVVGFFLEIWRIALLLYEE